MTPAPLATGDYYGMSNAAEEGASLRDSFHAMRKHLWLIIGICLLSTAIAALYMARKPDVYEAGARVQVDLENNGSAFNSGKTGSVVFNNPVSDPAYFNTQLQILTGPGLLRRVAKTLDLEHNKAFIQPQSMSNRSTWQSLQRMVGLGNKAPEKAKNPSPDEVLLLTSSVAPASSREDLAEAKRLAPFVREIQSRLRVEPVMEKRTGYSKETRLIDIRFTHTDPQVAAKVVNAIVNVFALSNLEHRTETNATAGDFLQRRIAELQTQIRASEERLLNYSKEHEILSLDASQNTVVERLTGLNRQLLEAENERKLAEAAYHAALRPGAASALAEDNQKEVAATEAKLAELRAKRAQLLVENTEEWPEVKEINQQIAVLEAQVQETRVRATEVVLSNLETRFRQTTAREQSLREAFEEQRGETLTQNEAAVNYRIIQQEIETNKGLLEGLLGRSKENDVVLAGMLNNIRVVDYAISPETAIGPKRLHNIALAFALALAFGIGFALFLEYLDDTVSSTDDVEKMLHLPALAVIPSIAGLTRRRLLSSVGALQRQNGNGAQHPELLINTDTRSSLAEAYRQLRTSVLLSTPGRAPKTILVTSSVPSEGKTTTAVNTSISLAQTGAGVLIIDADMRRPRVHVLFGMENENGLSTVLSSDMSESEVLATIKQDEATGVNILTAGSIPPNPAELIGSEQMRRLLAMLEPNFKHIVLDSPPVASFTDGVLTASLVDGVLLVVQGGKSSRDLARRTRQRLLEVGARIFGVVLNNVNVRSHDSYYQSYYHQSYYNLETEVDQLAARN
jgi:capsular exopolysaccharide synthesis family protein